VWRTFTKKPHAGDLVPSDVKIRAVILAQLHHTWSIKKKISITITRLLTSKMQLWSWKEQVKRGRNDNNKYAMINTWTYNQFTEALANKQHVTTWTLQQWGMAASFQFTFPGFPFRASAGWVMISRINTS
jgi:hypothetical protein